MYMNPATMKDRKGLCLECQRTPCACRACGHLTYFTQGTWKLGVYEIFYRCAVCGEPFRADERPPEVGGVR